MLKNNYIMEGTKDDVAEELYLLAEQVENISELAFLITASATESREVEILSRAIDKLADTIAEKMKAIAHSVGELGKV